MVDKILTTASKTYIILDVYFDARVENVLITATASEIHDSLHADVVPNNRKSC